MKNFTKEQPIDGENILHCGHLEGKLHFWKFAHEVYFKRPDGTVGTCLWITACDSCFEKRPEIAKQFDKYYDWFLKRFPEDKEKTKNDVFAQRTALVPEFAKIVCISVAFVMDNGTIKKQTFSGDDEYQLLMDVRNLLNRTHKLDFYLCGHNLKNFDIPMLAKRMIINGIMPSKILPSYDTKPWNARVKDKLENYLHREVCQGRMDRSEAQELITGNWIDSYCILFRDMNKECLEYRMR